MGNNNQTIIYDCGSKYVGQILNKKPHGKGLFYFKKSSLSFNPKLAANPQGHSVVQTLAENGSIKKCSIHAKSGFIFQGYLNNNSEFQGDGKMIDPQRVQYQGTFQNGKLIKGRIQCRNIQNYSQIAYICETKGSFTGTSILNGLGVYLNITEKYFASGEFHKGNLSNKGIYLYSNGDCYQGQFIQGSPTGQGAYRTDIYQFKQYRANAQDEIWQNNLVKQHKELSNRCKNELGFEYKGSFKKSFDGKGQLQFNNGQRYVGKFRQGKFHGYGQYRFGDGTVYKGSFYHGLMNGDCTIEYGLNSQINKGKTMSQILQKYEGQVSEGIFNGLGILYYANGVIFKGYFMDGAKNGPGVLIFCQNKFKCLFVMNKLIGQLKRFQQ